MTASASAWPPPTSAAPNSAAVAKRPQTDLVELGRDVGADHARRRDRIAHHPRHRLGLRRGLEESLSGQALPEDDPCGEQIDAAIERLAPDLLGREVLELSFYRPVRPGLREATGGERDAEVGHARHAVAADEQVVRRHVAVHEAERSPVFVEQLVHLVEPGQGVVEDAHRDADRHRPALLA